MEDTQRNWIPPWDGPHHPLKYRVQLKTKGWMGGIHRRLPGKAWLKRVSLSLCLTSPMTRFSGHLELSFFSWYRETSLPVDISLINVNFPYKKVTPTLFSQVLCVQFLKIILSANRQILRWHILVPRIPTFETYLRSFKVPELS